MQDFFNGVIESPRAQAENNRALSEGLIAQQRKQQGASRALAQGSANAYMDSLNSMFTCYRGNLDEAQRTTGRLGEGGGRRILVRGPGREAGAGACGVSSYKR